MSQQPRLNLPMLRRLKDGFIDSASLVSANNTLRDWGRYTDDTLAQLLLAHTGRCQTGMSTPQTNILDSTNTTLIFNTIQYDQYNWWSPSEPTLIRPTFPGLYRVTFATDWSADTDYTRLSVTILKNGTTLTPTFSDERGGTAVSLTPNQLASSPLIELDGINDTLSLQVLQANTSTGAATINAVFLVEYCQAVPAV